MVRKLLLRWLISAAAVYLATRWVSGISVDGGFWQYLWIALVLGLVNTLLGPIIKLLTCPLILLTLGVLALVINAALLWLTGAFVSSFQVTSFGSAMLGSIVISVVNLVLSVITGVNRDDDKK